jgi:predicted Zn-dependent peptidase
MAQNEQQQPREDQSAPERSDAEVRATIEATQKALEQSAAEIERAKRLLRETEDSARGAAQPTDTSKKNKS